MKAYTLFELNERIRRVLALNWPESIWVKGEIAQCSPSRGHYFITFVQKEVHQDDIIARIDGILWQSTYTQLKKKVGPSLNTLLQQGMEVLVKVNVDFNERFGLKLIIEDIDPKFTVGQLEIMRQETILQLQALHLLDKNAQLTFPPVLQRLAVLSSQEAAGYKDFMEQLRENAFGYTFYCKLFPMAVQGAQVEGELLKQLKKIKREQSNYDAIILVRGGGSPLDLAAFNRLEVGKAIADAPLPFLTGIGHEIDETVADKVAHTALKTPTAVADFIIHHNLTFENSILQLGQMAFSESKQTLWQQEIELDQFKNKLEIITKHPIQQQAHLLSQYTQLLPLFAHNKLKLAKQQLASLHQITHLLSPEATLKRGFGILRKEGKIINKQEEVKKSDRISIQMADGTIESIVESTSP